jgi:hypothetical protein
MGAASGHITVSCGGIHRPSLWFGTRSTAAVVAMQQVKSCAMRGGSMSPYDDAVPWGVFEHNLAAARGTRVTTELWDMVAGQSGRGMIWQVIKQ